MSETLANIPIARIYPSGILRVNGGGIYIGGIDSLRIFSKGGRTSELHVMPTEWLHSARGAFSGCEL